MSWGRSRCRWHCTSLSHHWSWSRIGTRASEFCNRQGKIQNIYSFTLLFCEHCFSNLKPTDRVFPPPLPLRPLHFPLSDQQSAAARCSRPLFRCGSAQIWSDRTAHWSQRTAPTLGAVFGVRTARHRCTSHSVSTHNPEQNNRLGQLRLSGKQKKQWTTTILYKSMPLFRCIAVTAIPMFTHSKLAIYPDTLFSPSISYSFFQTSSL